MASAIRAAARADIPAITAIYAEAVLHGTATFELDPPDEAEMEARFLGLAGGGFPYLVAEEDGRVVGYAYAGAYRARPAYRHTVEDSVYLDRAVRGRGIGKALLGALLAEAKARGFRQMIAVIGDTRNAPSIGLHRTLGFRPVGSFAGVGWKHGRWLDTVLMQRPLGPGSAIPPGG